MALHAVDARNSGYYSAITPIRPFFRRSHVVTRQMLRVGCISFSSVAAYLPHLETLRAYTPVSGYGFSDVVRLPELLPKLHTVERIDCFALHVESDLWTVLSLPSGSQILFPKFRSVDKAGITGSMSIEQVRMVAQRGYYC